MQKSICHKTWILVCKNYPCVQQYMLSAIVKHGTPNITEHI